MSENRHVPRKDIEIAKITPLGSHSYPTGIGTPRITCNYIGPPNSVREVDRRRLIGECPGSCAQTFSFIRKWQHIAGIPYLYLHWIITDKKE